MGKIHFTNTSSFRRHIYESIIFNKAQCRSDLSFYSFLVKTDGILDTKIVLCSVENANKVRKVMLYITGHILIR